MAKRADRPMLLIDLAVPRDIDPAALRVDSVYLYNIDQLSELGRMNLARRQTEAAACESMVIEHARQAAAAVLTGSTRPSAQHALAAREATEAALRRRLPFGLLPTPV
jgi:glutamyl-tRNA reductase